MAIRAPGHSSTGHISLSPTSQAVRWYIRPYHISSQHGRTMRIRRPGGGAKYSTLAQCSLGVTAVNPQHWTALMLISVTGYVSLNMACNQPVGQRYAWSGRVRLTSAGTTHCIKCQRLETGSCKRRLSLFRRPWSGSRG